MKQVFSKMTTNKSLRVGIIIALILFITLACLSSTPSPAEQQIEQAETMVVNLSADIDKAIADGDYYVAAINLQKLLGNPGIDTKINSIASHLQGGLLYQGTPPYYMSFISRDAQPLPNWPQTASKLLGITLDGRRGMVNEDYNNVDSFFIDFQTGSMTRYESLEPRPSPDFKWTISTNLYEGAIAHNVETGQQVPLCSPWSSPYRWNRDSTKVVAIDGTKQIVYIMDIPSGNCKEVNLPGLNWETEVLLSPNNQQLIILLTGSFTSVTKSQLLVANVDGTGVKKIADMPFYGSGMLLSPDGSAIYADGYVVSTRTGNFAKTLHPAIAWLDSAPPSSAPRTVQLSVEPPQGPRGTRFSFRLTGGPAGQEVAWLVSRSTDREQGMAYNETNLDNTGSLTDTQGQFGFDTGLSTEAGTYYVLVYIANEKIGMASFAITEP